MPAIVDKDKPKASKPEAFVEKQIEHARGRIRTLDFFQTGLVVLIATLAFIFAILLIDRAYETPRGTIWAVIFLFAVAAAGYGWYALFRPSRRHINPFYAAHQVEQTIPDAKNSVINYVDLQDDESVPASVKASIGARAAKDIKQVDLNRAIQKKQILWLAGIAGVFLVAALIAAFLPATRTTLVLLSPREGNVTVVQGQDVVFKVELNGRIPEKGQPDAARVRIWYNPDDPNNFEERPLEPVEGELNAFGHTMPAKQVRSGFFYQIFAGNVKTSAYEVKVRIIPQFTGTWEVDYVYPAYLNRQPEKKGDPNLVGYFNTQVTLTAHANRPVQSAVLEIMGHPQSYASLPVENDPEAMRFQLPLIKNGRYRIRFVTTDGQANPLPQPTASDPYANYPFRISLVDPKPALRFFEVTFDYPKYLRYENVTLILREPNLEVPRGTQVSLVASANRPIKQAFIQKGADAPIQGTPIEGQPMQVKFKLPTLLDDGAYRVWFTPDSAEPAADPRTYSIRIITDRSPEVGITNPVQQVTEVPANGSLGIEGKATDDHGLSAINLRFQVVKPAPGMPLEPKPYRGGISFLRKDDNSYPNQIDYKDVIELAKLERTKGVPFPVQPGMEIEFWLEAIDNCDVPPGPNKGISNKLLIKVIDPVMDPQKKKELDQERQKLEKDRRQHEQQQDQKNANEKRPVNQPKQRDDQQPPQQGGQPDEPNGEPGQNQKVDPKGGMGGMGSSQPDKDPNMDPPAQAELKKREAELKDALGKIDPMGMMEPDKEPTRKELGKDEPKAKEPKKEAGKEEPKATEPKKGEPAEPMMPESRPVEKPDPRQLPKPEDVKKLADQLKSDDKKEQQEAREQIKKQMEQAKNDQRKPEEAQKELDEHRKKLDEPERKQFDESLERVAKEMQDIQREKRVQDAVDKITSGNKEQREQGLQDLEKEMRDPKTSEQTQRQLQNLAGDMGTERQRQIGDAMNLAKENAKKPPKKGTGAPPPPMEKEEDNVDKLAKKKQKGTEEEKRQAENRLEEMLRDPATRDKVQKQLEDYKNSIKDKQEREDFEKSMKQIADNAASGKTPEQRRAEQIQKLAEQLKSDDKKERDAAQKALEETLKRAEQDPKAQADAQKQLKDTRDGIKDPKQQERFDQAVKEINDAVEKHRQEKAAAEQKMRQQLDDIAKGLNDKDPAKQQEAQQKLAEMLKDPKTREQVKDEIDKLKKKGDAATKDNIEKATEKAMDDIARREGLEKIARDLNNGDPDRKKDAQERLEEKLADPKTGGQAKKDLDKLKEGMKEKDARENIDKAIAEAEKNIAKNKQEAGKLANDLNSKDPQKQKAAQEKLEQLLRDPARREQIKNELNNIKKNAGDAQTRENIDKAVQKAAEDIARKEGLEKIANDLNSKNPDRQESAQRKLEEKLADPKSRDQVKNDLEKLKESLKEKDAADKLQKAVEQAEKNIAQNKQDAEKIAQDLTGKDKTKQDAAEKKLEELLNDPAKRDQVLDQLERLKQSLGDKEAKAKIDEAIKTAEQNNVAKKEGKGAPTKEDLEKIAQDLNSKDDGKAKAAEKKLLDALKNPKTRAKAEKDFNDIKDKLTDPGERQKLVDALNKAREDIAKMDKPLDPKEIEQLVKDLKDPKTKDAAQKKIDEMLNDPILREKLAKALEELMKNVKDGMAKKDLEDQFKDVKDKLTKFDPDSPGNTGHPGIPKGKQSGDNTKEPAKEGSIADLKNKVKSSELILEKFKRNITNEEFRKRLGWTDEQIAAFRKQYEQEVARLKKQLDYELKGEIAPRVTPGSSLLDRGEHVKTDPTDGSNPLQGGKYIAPPGFGDPYKRFTEELSGVRPALPTGKK